MLRNLRIGLTALVLTLATTAAIPNGVNLHNGYVVLINHVNTNGETPTYDVTFNDVPNGYRDTRKGSGSHLIIFNRCCIAAGTHYEIRVTMSVLGEVGYGTAIVAPRLCNVRGIPFGFAELVVTGNLARRETGAAIGKTLIVSQPIHGCPSE